MVNFTMLVRDRFRLTKQALESLGMVRYLTILDDRSEPETRDFLRYWGSKTGAFVARNDVAAGTGRLRNAVIEASKNVFGRGAYLYLSDCDVCFSPTWFETLIGCYELAWKDGYRVVGAYNHPYHQPVRQFTAVAPYYVNQVHALALQSMLMKWEVFEEYGPFCETPVDRVCQSEDVDFARKIVADGFKLGVVSPALIVNTGITNSFGEKIPGWELVKAQCPEGVICE